LSEGAKCPNVNPDPTGCPVLFWVEGEKVKSGGKWWSEFRDARQILAEIANVEAALRNL